MKSYNREVRESRAHLIKTARTPYREVDVDRPLSEQQITFVKAWASGETILTASARAGYSDGARYCYQLVQQPNVLALYNSLAKKYEDANQMSRVKVMDMLSHAYKCAELAEEPSSMVAAAREIGKMCGYYAPVEHKVDVSVTGSIIHRDLSAMSDSELLEIITKKQPPELPNES